MAAVDGMASPHPARDPEDRFSEFHNDIHEMVQQQGLSNDEVVAALKRKRFQDFQSYAFAEESLLPGGTSPILSAAFDDLESLNELFATAGPLVKLSERLYTVANATLTICGLSALLWQVFDMNNSATLTYQDYSVGWICALPTEMAAARKHVGPLHTMANSSYIAVLFQFHSSSTNSNTRVRAYQVPETTTTARSLGQEKVRSEIFIPPRKPIPSYPNP
jgi:hypothetical protein